MDVCLINLSNMAPPFIVRRCSIERKQRKATKSYFANDEAKKDWQS